MPYFPSENESKAYCENSTSDNKLISDYANISIPETFNLDVFTYWGLLHDAVVYVCNKTEKGKEYLERAYNHSQTEPDRETARKFFGR